MSERVAVCYNCNHQMGLTLAPPPRHVNPKGWVQGGQPPRDCLSIPGLSIKLKPYLPWPISMDLD